MDEKIYQEELLEHFKYPKHRKRLQDPDFTAGHYNPSCGDRISIEGKFDNQHITDLGFTASGCVISQATASMLTELCIGKTAEQILQLNKDDIVTLIGIPLGPTRLKCALLSLEVLHQGLVDHALKKQ